MSEASYPIVPANLAVGAMRDNGYKNAAYALAELIDNSIEAGAKHVEVLCSEIDVMLIERKRRQVQRIAVLDDGGGMNEEVLRTALQFGNGTHLENPTGIGRFGMGLPSASISQCRRVEVWTWQDGVDSAIRSYIDISQIENGSMTEIPRPVRAEVPREWVQSGNTWGPTGTLVVWSNIDRCIWKEATAIFRNSEFVIGRMYRRFLSDGRVSIRLSAFLESAPQEPTSDQPAVPNDPMYLMTPTSCPAPYDKQPMFKRWGENWERKIVVKFEAADHEVCLRFSYAKEDARKALTPGSTAYGRHAGRNIGVSIMRAERELELSQAWVIQYDPTERWWGVEIEFPPALDNLFGVSNNKQTARSLDEVASMDPELLLEDGKTFAELRDEMAEDAHPVGPLLEISQAVKTNLDQMRKLLKLQTKHTRRLRHHEDTEVEKRATQITELRKLEGLKGASDDEESLPAGEREKAIQDDLVGEGVSAADAATLAAHTVDEGLKYLFNTAHLESYAFFTAKPSGGAILITLNMDHPAYEHLIEVTEEPETADAGELRERLRNANDGLKLLMIAWARFEDEQLTSDKKSLAQDIRSDWGRIARDYLAKDE